MSTVHSFDSVPPSGDLTPESVEGDATLRFYFESRTVAEKVKRALVRTAGISDAQILRIKIKDDDNRCSLKIRIECTDDLERLQKNIERIISECVSDERSDLKKLIEEPPKGEGLITEL